MLLTLDDRDALVMALERCRSLAKHSRRVDISQHLPESIRDAIDDDLESGAHLRAIVHACGDVARGLHDLGQALLAFECKSERPTPAMHEVGILLLRMTTAEVIYYAFRDDLWGLGYFISLNLAIQLPANNDPVTQAHAAALAAQQRGSLDAKFIEQLRQHDRVDDQGRAYLADIERSWLSYARKRPAGARPTTAPAGPARPSARPDNRTATRGQPEPVPTTPPVLAMQPAPRPAPRPAATRPAGPPSRLILVLDRLRQWETLTFVCNNTRDHCVFLLHGTADQDLGLFIERVQDYLDEDCHPPHRVHKVKLSDDFTTANTPELWALHLRRALGAGKQTAMANVLRNAALHQPIMLLLGNGPLGLLDAASEQALITFVECDLPAWIREASPMHPVRVIIPVESRNARAAGNPENPLLARVRHMLRESDLAPFRSSKLVEFEWPPWDHVALTLDAECRDALGPRYPAFEAEAAAYYNDLSKWRTEPGRPPVRFEDLGRALDRLYHEWLNKPAP